ncbi:MAG: helix-turn-helix transcriptional regulator [Phormidium sp.]
MSNQICPITLGRIIIAARHSQGLSQRELAMLLSAKIGSEFSFVELSKIENDRLDVCDQKYDNLIQSFCDLFDVDRNWVEQIRNQTEPEPLDLSKAVFPVHINCCLTDGY